LVLLATILCREKKTPRNCIKGVEHTINEGNDFHIIEYPNYDFRFLAHPLHTFKGNERKVEDAICSYDLDGLELYRMGRKQFFKEHSGVYLSNSDAHSKSVVGSSYIVVDASSQEEAMRKIKRGDYSVKHRRVGVCGVFLHKLHKGFSML